MIKSMTGYGRGEYNDGKRNIIAEVRAINHRYSEVSVRMPRRYSFAEEKIKAAVKSIAKRGKIEVAILVENVTEDDVNIRLNTLLAKQYIDNLRELKDTFDLNGELNVQFVASLPDVMKSVADIGDEEQICKALEIPVLEAVKALDVMRAAEGRKLAEDILKRGELIRRLAARVEERSPEVVKTYRVKLADRIHDLLEKNVEVPEERIAVECAIFADKCSVTEELVRLESHIGQLNTIISSSNQPDGKKLDFLIQEMNREANTIGSKANDITITNLVLEIKSEIEKIREQVQNIE